MPQKFWAIRRDPSILLLISPIFLSSNSFTFHLLCSKFCSLKNIHLPEVYIKNFIILLIKYITNLNYVCKKGVSGFSGMDSNGGLERWNGMVDWNGGMEWTNWN